ncbi:DMT family transporter [Gordonia soli]|nr:DMT family transporter [Gordonia soli]
MPTDRPLPLRLAVPTVLLFAAGYPIGAATVAVMSPFLVILLRFALSAILLWGVIAARRTPLPNRRQVGHAVIAGVLTQGVQFLGVYWGLAHGISAGLAALVIALNPVLTATLVATVLGQRESRRGMLALGLATLAVLLACAPKVIADHRVGPGVIAVIIAMIGLSAGGVYQSRKCQGIDVWVLTAIGVTASTPLAGALAMTAPMTVTDVPRAIVLLAVMVVVSSAVGTTLYAACIKHSGPRASSLLFAVIPAVTGVMAWAVLGERLTWFTVAGLVIGAAACLVQARSMSGRVGAVRGGSGRGESEHAARPRDRLFARRRFDNATSVEVAGTR